MHQATHELKVSFTNMFAIIALPKMANLSHILKQNVRINLEMQKTNKLGRGSSHLVSLQN